MKMEDIIRRLQSILPKHTNYFTDTLSISSLTRSGSTVTAVTSAPHGLSTNNYVNIYDAKEDNPIVSLTQINNIATAVTQYPHDITNTNRYFQSIAEISGANESDYNGIKALVLEPQEFDIISIIRSGQTATVTTKQKHGFVVDSNFYVEIFDCSVNGYNDKYNIASIIDDNTFTISVLGTPINATDGKVKTILNRYVFMFDVQNNPGSPATGSVILQEDKLFGYNGRHQITVLDDTIFKYTITGTPITPASGTIIAETSARISGVVNLERSIESYTKKLPNKYWAFVEMGDVFVSKDRRTTTDALYRYDKGKSFDQDLYQNFLIHVFAPTSEQISARDARDTMPDIRVALYKSLLNAQISSGLSDSSNSIVVAAGDGFSEYLNAFYVHTFEFQNSFKITESDVSSNEDNIAARDFEIDYVVKNEVTFDDDVVKQDQGKFDN